MNRINVLLVDDNQHFLETAADFLSSYPTMNIVGRAASGPEALQMIEEAAPDLVILDLSMPVMNGLEATRKIKARPFPPCVVMLTLYEGPEFSSFARSAGVDGFITKSEFGEALLPLIFGLFPDLQPEAAHEIA
jgi:CheY-like chemotaxis protein